MLQTRAPISTSAPRPPREDNARAHLGAEVLGIAHLNPRSRLKQKAALRYNWFAGRTRALEAIGVIAADHGPVAARLAGDAVLGRLAEGIRLTTREAAYVCRETAFRLVNGGRT
jgi:hypothetical protein